MLRKREEGAKRFEEDFEFLLLFWRGVLVGYGLGRCEENYLIIEIPRTVLLTCRKV